MGSYLSLLGFILSLQFNTIELSEEWPIFYADMTGELPLSAIIGHDASVRRSAEAEVLTDKNSDNPFYWKLLLDNYIAEGKIEKFRTLVEKFYRQKKFINLEQYENTTSAVGYAMISFKSRIHTMRKKYTADEFEKLVRFDATYSGYPKAKKTQKHYELVQLIRSYGDPQAMTSALKSCDTNTKTRFSYFFEYTRAELNRYGAQRADKSVIEPDMIMFKKRWLEVFEKHPDQPTAIFKTAFLLKGDNPSKAASLARKYIGIESRQFKQRWVKLIRTEFKF
jgi:hypothetical protein